MRKVEARSAIDEARLTELLTAVRPSLNMLLTLQSELQAALASPKGQSLYRESPAIWAGLYELPFLRYIALATVKLGLQQHLSMWAHSADLHATRLQLLAGNTPDPELPTDTAFGEVAALVISLIRNFIAKQHYGVYMNELVASVRDEGSKIAFLKAVRVDRSVLACPTFSAQLAEAELRRDRKFLGSVGSALKEPPKTWDVDEGALRIALQIIRDVGALDQLTPQIAYRLLCENTGLYRAQGDEPPEIGRAVQQECRDRSRMPSSA
eukprot:TRINITY_DN8432_c0_g1_i3.p1 TRINITY_DN8432_c0_g1~~TRINITY_DN8432_c0_g1_i3.p1  ORF type:complete len:267 (-),score=13.05 TRINITY_DN8432_c0_g1_i3:28-828(-)